MSETNPKKILRHEMKALRSQKAALFPDAAIKAKDIFLNHFSQFSSYALYSPMENELSTLPLIKDLTLLGKVISLPQVSDKGLVFRKWTLGDELVKGAYQTWEPSPDATVVMPEIVVVPLLAFDLRGYRLGYGKGYYDRALHDLKQNHNLTAVGYGYSFQRVEFIPSEPHDERLNFIVTENDIYDLSL